MMLKLNDGRSELWQWDTGRTLSVDADCSQVHFSNKILGRSIDVDVVDGEAIIPDVLLQTDKDLTAWAFVGTAENGYTKISKVFKVNKRNKPADYVFTPTDQTTLGEILDRIEDLENRTGADISEEEIQNAVNDYFEKNPISVEEKDPTVPSWAKQPEKPTYTAKEVGALSAETKIPEPYVLPVATAASLGGIKAEPAEETDTQPVRIGGDGKLYTAPGGGTLPLYGSGWQVITDFVLEEDGDSATSMLITQTDEGKPFAYREVVTTMGGTILDYMVSDVTGYIKSQPYPNANGTGYLPYDGFASSRFGAVGGGKLTYFHYYGLYRNLAQSYYNGWTGNQYKFELISGDYKVQSIKLHGSLKDSDGTSYAVFCPLKAGGRVTIYGR